MAMGPINSTLPSSVANLAYAPAGPSPDSNFRDSLRAAVSEVDNLHFDAQYKVNNLVTGDGADVHEAMIAVEKADLSFQLMLQVRNKVVQAYQQVANMQF